MECDSFLYHCIRSVLTTKAVSQIYIRRNHVAFSFSLSPLLTLIHSDRSYNISSQFINKNESHLLISSSLPLLMYFQATSFSRVENVLSLSLPPLPYTHTKTPQYFCSLAAKSSEVKYNCDSLR